MKKSIILSIIACCAAFTSCNMDEMPSTSIPTDESILTVKDCQPFSNMLHAEWRGYVQNAYSMDALVQSGLLTATADYGNTYGYFYRWAFEITDGAFSGCWADNYYIIANANHLIKGGQNILANDAELSENDKAYINHYVGQAYFSRAYAYFELALHYCKNYDPASAGSDYGIPLVTEYAPSSDYSKYPGRSSLKETFDFIVKDLEQASNLVGIQGEAQSAYITLDVVEALKARVYLEMEDYQNAAAAAQGLINSKRYTLISDGDAYKKMWLNDVGTEAIWQFAMSKTETGSNALGSSFMGIVDKLPRPSYLPVKSVLNLYDKENDIRYDAYFTTGLIDRQVGDDIEVTYCSKWPGNPELYEGKSNNVNKLKAFRISEMYLIAAEAYAMLNQEDKASEMLNELKKIRIKGWTETVYNGAALMQEIQDERVRELFAEGNRLFDMKRWKIGMKRSSSDAQRDDYLPALGTDIEKEATDNRWVWPIPKDEMDSNPQLKGQQNPGY